MPDPRWSPAVQASTAFTDDQARRVHALRVAREVTEQKGQGTFGASGGVSVDYKSLIEVAQWIMDGTTSLEPVIAWGDIPGEEEVEEGQEN